MLSALYLVFSAPCPPGPRYQLTCFSPFVAVTIQWFEKPPKTSYDPPYLDLHLERRAEDMGGLAGRRRFPAQRGDGLLCGVFALSAVPGADRHPGLRARGLAAGRQRPRRVPRTGQKGNQPLAGRPTPGPAGGRAGQCRAGRPAGGRDAASRRHRRFSPARLHVRPHFRHAQAPRRRSVGGATSAWCSTIASRPFSCSWPWAG